MNIIKFYIAIFVLFSFGISNTPHWLVEIDCEENLKFFEIRTLNTYNLDNCSNKDSNCGEYINLMHHSIFHNNKPISNQCDIGGRLLEYSLVPVNMAGSVYDLTPHFVFNLLIDNRKVIQDLPLFPSPLYDKSLWGLKISSIRFNGNAENIEIIVSDDELYEQTNSNKMNSHITWLWDSKYMSAFDPDWKSKWHSITENDIWDKKNFNLE